MHYLTLTVLEKYTGLEGRTETEMKIQKSSDFYWEDETIKAEHKAGVRGQII